MKGYPSEDIVRALRAASGLGGPGVAANPAFNRWTLETSHDTIRALEAYGYRIVAVEDPVLSPVQGPKGSVRDDASR